jgi:hypothetical protein
MTGILRIFDFLSLTPASVGAGYKRCFRPSTLLRYNEFIVKENKVQLIKELSLCC